MLFFVVYVVVIGILVLAAYMGARSGVIQRFLGMYPWVPKLLVMGYVVFAGCVVFPISSEPFPLDFQKGYLLGDRAGLGRGLGTGTGASGLRGGVRAHCGRDGLPVPAGVWRGVECL